MRIEYSHKLSREDALARLRALSDYLTNRHKIAVQWNGDRATFSGRFKKIVKIVGELTVGEGKVLFSGEDPGVLWRGQATRYIAGKLDRYLDPAEDLARLPRA